MKLGSQTMKITDAVVAKIARMSEVKLTKLLTN